MIQIGNELFYTLFFVIVQTLGGHTNQMDVTIDQTYYKHNHEKRHYIKTYHVSKIEKEEAWLFYDYGEKREDQKIMITQNMITILHTDNGNYSHSHNINDILNISKVKWDTVKTLSFLKDSLPALNIHKNNRDKNLFINTTENYLKLENVNVSVNYK